MKRVVIVPVSGVERFPDHEILARDGSLTALVESPLLLVPEMPTTQKLTGLECEICYLRRSRRSSHWEGAS